MKSSIKRAANLSKSGRAVSDPRQPFPVASLDNQTPERRVSPELVEFLNAQETRVVLEADNVGMEQLVAALMRIPIPHRKPKPKAKAKTTSEAL